jgi:GAF domain-containing protein
MPERTFYPPNEAQRLLAVQPYAQLLTKQEVFQALVQLTARLFVVPMSIMSLVEAEEVQYPGNVGMPQLPLRLARIDCICSAAVYTSTTTVFSDLRTQPCPWVSPAAQAQTDFQFYAGHPLLTTAGYAIGTLCVLDAVPRAFTVAEQTVLQQLAELAMRLLDLHLLLAQQAVPAPAIWAGIEARLAFSIQRIETLTALARRAASAAAASYYVDIEQEQQFILADIDYNVRQALAQAILK